MSSPVLWVLLPAFGGLGLLALRRWPRLVTITGVSLALALVWSAWQLPIAHMIQLGPLSFEISDTLTVLGRRLVLVDEERYLLILIYLAAAFWFGGSYIAGTEKSFVPVGLIIVALMTAALAVEPFLYAALFIELTALLCIPLLAPPGRLIGRGVVRFFTFQTLGVPFLLFSGWMLTGLQVNPDDPVLQVQAAILLALGFSLLLAVFPFHTWMPMLAEESHPYVTAFVLFMLPGITSLFGLSFFERYEWLRDTPGAFSLLRIAGALMTVVGGVWAIFQNDLGRILGYATMVETGLSFLAIGASQGVFSAKPLVLPPSTLIYGIFVSRFIAMGLWALALSTLRRQKGDLSFKAVEGSGRRMPVVATCLILAHFSIAGFPLLAGYPVHLAIWGKLASISYPIAFWSMTGSAFLLISGIRCLRILLTKNDQGGWQINESRSALLFLIIGAVALVLAGFVPQY